MTLSIADWMEKGLAYHETADFAQARDCYETVLQQEPHHALATHLLGLTWYQQGDLAQALPLFLRAIEQDKQQPTFHSNLAMLYEALGTPQEALLSWINAFELDPHQEEPAFRLGKLQYTFKQYSEAHDLFQHVLLLNPNHQEAQLFLAQTLSKRGQALESQQMFEQLYQQTGREGLLLRALFTFPVIYPTQVAIDQWREGFQQKLHALSQKQFTVKNPVVDIGMTPFYLAYQGQNDEPLMRQLGDLFAQKVPPRTFQQQPPARKKPKLMVVSRYLTPSHTIGRVFLPLLEQLSRRDTFDWVASPILRHGEPVALEKFSGPILPLPFEDYWGACDTILKQAPDILLYLDIGMEPFSYYLALQRLAPLQCVTWGHPVTTGLPHVDAYLSSQWFEPSLGEAQQAYREKLILLPELPTYFPKPAINVSLPTEKTELGFSNQETLYVCPQSLFKFHPGFDALLADILRQDPTGRLLVFQGDVSTWEGQLRARWETVMPDVVHRVNFLPYCSRDEFLKLLSICDVMLDIPTFNGGNTTLDALSVGLPIVTMEGPLMKQRLTGGILRRAGLETWVTQDEQTYLATVLSLGKDPTQRETAKQKIFEQHHTLYENVHAIDAFELGLLQAAELFQE